MKEQKLFTGKLLQVVSREDVQRININNGIVKKEIQYEMVKRPPGIRAIILQENKILLNMEYRYELRNWDYRLPGGKVFDSFLEYDAARNRGELNECINHKLKQELIEEADIEPCDYQLIHISPCGMTVEWDLYYYLVRKFQIMPSFYNENVQKSEFEYIHHVWADYGEVVRLCVEGKISEDRSIGVLLKLLLSKELK